MNRRWLGMLAMALVASLSMTALAQAPPPAETDPPGAPAEDAKPEPEPPAAPVDEAEPEPGAPVAEPRPDPQQACMDAFGRSQRLRREGRLLEGREELLRCAQPTCMAVVRNKCLEWLEQVEDDLPTVVIAVIGRDGQPPEEVKILVDGNEAPDASDGRAFAVDPGEHIVRVELPGGGRQKRVATVLQGQKNQSLIFDFQPPKPPPSSVAPVTIVQSSSTNVPAAIAFSVGGVSLLAGIITGAIALNDGDDLEEQCNSTGCTPDEIDRGLAVAHASTATLAIAGVAGALGVTFLFVFGEDDDTTAAFQLAPTGGQVMLHF